MNVIYPHLEEFKNTAKAYEISLTNFDFIYSDNLGKSQQTKPKHSKNWFKLFKKPTNIIQYNYNYKYQYSLYMYLYFLYGINQYLP